MGYRDDVVRLVNTSQHVSFGGKQLTSGIAAVALALLDVADAIRESKE